MYIKPWNEESERILKQLSLSGKAYTKNMMFSKSFGRKIKTSGLDDAGFLELFHNRRKQKTCFVTPPGIAVIPKLGERGINYHFKKYKFL